MVTIDQLIAAFMLGGAIFTCIGHAAGYGKGLRRGKADTLTHIRSIVDKAPRRTQRAVAELEAR